MALRFWNEFRAKDDPATQWRIEIHDADWVGVDEEFDCDSPGQILRWAADSEERHSVIRGSELTFNFRMETSTQEDFIYDLQSSSEGRFSVCLKKGASEVLYWAGVILPDISGYQDRSPFVLQVTATDGIAALSKIQYRQAPTVLYTGKDTFIGHLIRALKKLPYVTTHWAGGEDFLVTAVDWWEQTFDVAKTVDPLFLSGVDHAAFYRLEQGDLKSMPTLGVIDAILRAFGCRIMLLDGSFYVDQISYRQTSYTVRKYDINGAQTGIASQSTINSVNNTAPNPNMSWKSFLNYDYYPGLLEANITFDTYQRRNYLAGITLNDANTSFETNYPIFKSTDGTVLRFRMVIQHKVKNISYTGGQSTPIYLKFQGTLRLSGLPDSKNWRRFGYFAPSTYQINYAPGASGSWEAIGPPEPTFDVLGVIGRAPPTGFTTTNLTILDQDLPPLENDVYAIELNFDFLEFRDGQNNLLDPTDFQIEWSASEMYLGTYTNGIQTIVSDSDFYVVANDEDQYTAKYEDEVIIGSSDDLNTIGAVWVSGGGGWTLGGDWGNGTDPTDTELGNLLAQAVLAGQLRPIKKANGTVRGDFNPRRLFSWTSNSETILYLFHSGDYNLEFNELQGLFHEMDYGGTFATSPIKKKKKLIVDPAGSTTFPPYNPGGNANNQPGFAVNNPPGTLIPQLADAKTSQEIAAGAVTTIPTRTLSDGEFWSGEYISLINPLTGAQERLQITATSAAGDTALTVSGTVQGNFPPFTSIVRDRTPGRWPYPSSNVGDILYFNGTDWVKSTIGGVLFNTLPSYVSDEDAIAGGLFEFDWYIAAVGHVAIKAGTLTSVSPS